MTGEFADNPIIQAIRANRAAHAYILLGAGGEKLAATASRMLMCPALCGRCPECVRALSGNHPDILEVRAQKRSIGVDAIRDCISAIGERPVSVERRAVILYNAESMTEAAQNCLLKTLENPPAYAMFLLVCENIGGLLPTVISRCAVIRAGAAAKETVRDNPEYSDVRGRMLGVLRRLPRSNMMIEGYALRADGDKIRLMAAVTIELLLDTLRAREPDELASIAKAFTHKQIQGMIKVLFETEQRLNANVNAKTAFDYWFIRTQEVLDETNRGSSLQGLR